MLGVLREVVARLRDRGVRAARVCANGHVVQPSWDVCPFCLEEERRLAAVPGPAAPGTIVLEPAAEKRSPVCGWLVALDGAHEGEDFRLRLGRNVIGTGADCEVVITGKGISRKHCAIRSEGGEYRIADLDSRNGTWVNGRRVQTHDLIDNDVIKLGDVEFEFKCRAVRGRRTTG